MSYEDIQNMRAKQHNPENDQNINDRLSADTLGLSTASSGSGGGLGRSEQDNRAKQVNATSSSSEQRGSQQDDSRGSGVKLSAGHTTGDQQRHQ